MSEATFECGLIDRDGKPLPDRYYEDKNKYRWVSQQRVGRTNVTCDQGKFTVSTVWLMGVDHAHRLGASPLIFETMVFGDPYDNELARYSTEEQAMRGHLEVLERLRAGRHPFDPFEDGEEAS